MMNLFYEYAGLLMSFILMMSGMVVGMKIKRLYTALTLIFLGFLVGVLWIISNQVELEYCECCGQILR